MAKSPPTTLDDYIGQRLKAVRQEQGLSAAKVAEWIDASQQQLSRYKNGLN